MKRACIALGGVGGLVVLVGGCAGPAGAPQADAKPPAASTAEGGDQFDDAAANLKAMFDRSRNPREAIAPDLASLAGDQSKKSQRVLREATPEEPAPVATAFVGPPFQPAEPTKPSVPDDPAARRNALLDELTHLLETGTGDPAGAELFRKGVQLALVEALQPGAAAASLRRLEPDLSPQEFKALEGLCEAMHSVATGSAATANPEGLASVLREVATKVSPERAVRIQTVALCQKVESFGRYMPFADNSFPAGRSQDVIVYVEVDNFAERPWSGATDSSSERLAGPSDQAPQWVSELGQEVTLYSADGYQALYKPEQVVRDVARRSRRDYFLVQKITLPPTLAIGRYTLKVTVRDKSSKAEAQLNVPVTIVDGPTASAARVR